MVVDEILTTLARRYAIRAPQLVRLLEAYETACCLASGPDLGRCSFWRGEAVDRETRLRSAVRIARNIRPPQVTNSSPLDSRR